MNFSYCINNMQCSGYLAVAIWLGYFIGAIIFAYLGEQKMKEKVTSWLMKNDIGLEKEKELMIHMGYKLNDANGRESE